MTPLHLLGRLRAGFAFWLRLGPVTGTRIFLGLVLNVVRAPVRRWRLRLQPLTVSRRDLRRALGGRTPAEAVARARPPLPTVAAWKPGDDVVPRAEEVLAHRFDLLGSGPTDLGPVIDWQRDFKSGRSWPLRHISETVIVYPDASDIKVPWELTRFQHLPLLAAAHRRTGERRFLKELEAQIISFIAASPVEFGATWACTMDVAIRAANWTAALTLLPDVVLREPWVERALGSLLLHARFIRSHLEWGEARGNHYLSDIAGLLVVAALFRDSREGRAWIRWAVKELASEMEHQVRPDGVDHEASIPYHRLVTEIFVVATRAAEDLTPGALPAAYHERLRRMLSFAADAARPGGIAPSVGDDDSGRFLPLDDHAKRDLRDHRHLFDQAGVPAPAPAGHAAYPEGGYWVMRGGDLWALVRCGDVGIYGRGCHAHNDALSFELALRGQPLVADPGSYLYTADPEARNAFRSTGAHATVQLDNLEQNPITDRLFVMEERARPACTAWEPGSDGRAAFAGRHEGFAPAVHERRFDFDGPAAQLVLTDIVRSPSAHDVTWTFPLAQPDAVTPIARGAEAAFGDVILRLEVDRAVAIEIADGWLSLAYGRRVPTRVVRLRARSQPGEDRTRIALTAR